MPRTVDSALVPPAAQAQALAEVQADDGNDGGVHIVASAQNTLYEQKLGQIVWDETTDADYIVRITSDTAYYRARNCIQEDNASYDVLVSLRAALSGGPGKYTVRVTDVTSSNTLDIDLDTDGAWSTPQVLSLDDSAEDYHDFTISPELISGLSSAGLTGVSIYYRRNKSTLDAVTSGSAQYTNGFVPHDVAQYADEGPLSVAMLADMHGNARYLWRYRVGTVITGARVGGRTVNSGMMWVGIPPQGVDTIRVWVRSDAAGSLTITGTTQGTVQAGDAGQPASLSSGWTGPFVLSVTEGIVEEFVVDGESTSVESLCAWWETPDFLEED